MKIYLVRTKSQLGWLNLMQLPMLRHHLVLSKHWMVKISGDQP